MERHIGGNITTKSLILVLQCFTLAIQTSSHFWESLQASDLDCIVEERANVLEIVSERLSKHVLANYDVFVEGINEAASVEADLEVDFQLQERGRIFHILQAIFTFKDKSYPFMTSRMHKFECPGSLHYK